MIRDSIEFVLSTCTRTLLLGVSTLALFAAAFSTFAFRSIIACFSKRDFFRSSRVTSATLFKRSSLAL